MTASPGPTFAEIRAVALAAVPEVLEAVERGDVEALLALTFRHLGFCGWPLRDADAPIASEAAHQARNACNPDVRYWGVKLDGYAFEGGLDLGGGFWTEEALRDRLVAAFAVPVRLEGVEVQRYRRALTEAPPVVRERLTLTFSFLGDTGLEGEDRADQVVVVNGLVLEVEAGEELPVTRLAFPHRSAPPSQRLVELEPSPLRVTADAGPSVRTTSRTSKASRTSWTPSPRAMSTHCCRCSRRRR